MAQQPCLPVPRRRKRDDDGFSQVMTFENIESMDAMEYMAAVVQQANTLPDVFVAQDQGMQNEKSLVEKRNQLPIEGSAASLSYLISERTAILPPLNAHQAPPSRSWVDQTLSNFSQLRSYLEKCKREGVGGKATNRRSLPPMKDRPRWHVFCVGHDDASGNVGSYFDDDDESMCSQQDEPEWRIEIPSDGHEPSVRLLLQMDQVMVRRVLSHLAYYVEDGWSPSSKQRSAWIYALLARLEQPLHRDDAAMLFGLLKDLTQARAALQIRDDGSREALARLNTMIAIVGLYFQQGGGYGAIMKVR